MSMRDTVRIVEKPTCYTRWKIRQYVIQDTQSSNNRVDSIQVYKTTQMKTIYVTTPSSASHQVLQRKARAGNMQFHGLAMLTAVPSPDTNRKVMSSATISL